MTRDEYKVYLATVLDDEYLRHDGIMSHAIYMIDDIIIGGDFTSGSRANDHNVLMTAGITWIDIINWGTVMVPETKSYISDTTNILLEDIGYHMIATNDNHIVGYKHEA